MYIQEWKGRTLGIWYWGILHSLIHKIFGTCFGDIHRVNPEILGYPRIPGFPLTTFLNGKSSHNITYFWIVLVSYWLCLYHRNKKSSCSITYSLPLRILKVKVCVVPLRWPSLESEEMKIFPNGRRLWHIAISVTVVRPNNIAFFILELGTTTTTIPLFTTSYYYYNQLWNKRLRKEGLLPRSLVSFLNPKAVVKD